MTGNLVHNKLPESSRFRYCRIGLACYYRSTSPISAVWNYAWGRRTIPEETDRTEKLWEAWCTRFSKTRSRGADRDCGLRVLDNFTGYHTKWFVLAIICRFMAGRGDWQTVQPTTKYMMYLFGRFEVQPTDGNWRWLRHEFSVQCRASMPSVLGESRESCRLNNTASQQQTAVIDKEYITSCPARARRSPTTLPPDDRCLTSTASSLPDAVVRVPG